MKELAEDAEPLREAVIPHCSHTNPRIGLGTGFDQHNKAEEVPASRGTWKELSPPGLYQPMHHTEDAGGS